MSRTTTPLRNALDTYITAPSAPGREDAIFAALRAIEIELTTLVNDPARCPCPRCS